VGILQLALAAPVVREIIRASTADPAAVGVLMAFLAWQLVDITHVPAAMLAQLGSILLAVGMLHGCRMAHVWAQQVKLK
jgi:hypothetical protein